MTDKLKKKPATRRDAVDAARLKLAGDPSHINASEDALLRAAMPEAHGRVVTSGLLAEAGRRGDDRVTLLIPEEAALLKARGGSGAVNPLSGLLEYNNGSDSDNTSAAGENTGGMDTSSPNSGVTGNEGPSASNGGNSGSYSSDYGGFGLSGSIYSTPSIANMSLAQMESISKQINDDIDSNYQGMFGTGFTDRTDGWASPDTGYRALQEAWYGPAYNAPGRYGMPNAIGPGILGTAVTNLAGPMFGGFMKAGDAFGRAQSQQERDNTAAGFGALGAMNSTGQERDSHTGLSFAELDARGVPGAASGSATAGLLAQQTGVGGTGTGSSAPGVPTVQPGGLMQTDDRSNNTMTGLPAPIQNLLADYIWRGRQGSGFNW